MKVSYIEEKDIDEIEASGKACFLNMNLDDLGLKYCSKSYKDNLMRYITNDNYLAIKCVCDNVIFGALCGYGSPQIFSNNHSAFNVFMMQALPSLKPFTKGRVIKKLLNKTQDLCKAAGIHVLQVGTMASNDMSTYFERRNYKQGDIFYYKEVN